MLRLGEQDSIQALRAVVLAEQAAAVMQQGLGAGLVDFKAVLPVLLREQ
jgi:hypothetical protein